MPCYHGVAGTEEALVGGVHRVVADLDVHCLDFDASFLDPGNTRHSGEQVGQVGQGLLVCLLRLGPGRRRRGGNGAACLHMLPLLHFGLVPLGYRVGVHEGESVDQPDHRRGRHRWLVHGVFPVDGRLPARRLAVRRRFFEAMGVDQLTSFEDEGLAVDLREASLALGRASLEQLLNAGQAGGDVLASHTASVERPHGQLRSRLADGLRRDDPDGLSDQGRAPCCGAAPVAGAADAALCRAG